MFSKIRIRKHERGLWFRHGDFVRLLEPGAYRIGWPINLRNSQVQIVSTLTTRFEHPMLDILLEDSALRESLLVVDLSDSERALLWKDQRLAAALGPGRYAFWMTPYRLTVDKFSIDSFRLDHPKLAAILQHADAARWLDAIQVEASQQVLLYRDGALVEKLDRGLHVFWKGTGKLQWKAIDLREQVADVAGQEIMTSDKVTLRVNLVVAYQVIDPEKAATVVASADQALYRDAQLALRAAIGTRALDALLGDKESVGGEVRQAIAARAQEYGIAVRSVGLRDIILPGDMKTLLKQVIAATKEAEANLIRRREETAAARSQANTAKLLAENPQLARLKELEALQAILTGAKATFVFGPGDIATQVRALATAKDGA